MNFDVIKDEIDRFSSYHKKIQSTIQKNQDIEIINVGMCWEFMHKNYPRELCLIKAKIKPT